MTTTKMPPQRPKSDRQAPPREKREHPGEPPRNTNPHPCAAARVSAHAQR